MFAAIALSRVAAMDDVSIVAVAITSVLPGSSSKLGSLRSILRKSGGAYLVLKLFVALGSRMVARLLGRPTSLVSLVRLVGHDPEVRECVRSDTPDMIAWWQSKNLDILLSAGATHRFLPELLAVPRIAVLNQHPSLLPRYAGTDPYFWCLLKGDRETGVTVHVAREKLDAGEVVAQSRIDISDCDSVLEIVGRLWQASTTAVSDGVGAVRVGTAVPQAIEERTFFRSPTRADVAALRARGKSILSRRGFSACIAAVRTLPRTSELRRS